MTSRLALPLSVAAMLFAAQGADASTYLGSPDTTAAPDAYVCAACPAGDDASASASSRCARRRSRRPRTASSCPPASTRSGSRGTEDPRIAILRPDEDGVCLRVVDSAPMRAHRSRLHVRVDDLHLPMQRGDSVGFLFRTGEVDLGVKLRPRPDGAIQSFTTPCDPCGMDGGTGVELLMDAVLEPDVDADGMGDESQDADGGGLGNGLGGRLVRGLR